MEIKVYGDAAVHVAGEEKPERLNGEPLVLPYQIWPVADTESASMLEWPDRLTEQVRQEDWFEVKRNLARAIGAAVLGVLFGLLVGALIFKG